MQVLIPTNIAKDILAQLERAGKKEIGGLLFGEHLGNQAFKIVGITTQKNPGTETEFQRDPTQHADQLNEFFSRTGEDYERFNYFGEWHSHPSFPVLPSGPDLRTLREIVEDPSVGANFLVLLIVRKLGKDQLSLSATVYGNEGFYENAPVYMELEPVLPQVRTRRRLL